MVPDEWLPVSRDGMGNELGVSSPTVFVNGGGGSVFYPNPNLNPNPNPNPKVLTELPAALGRLHALTG